MKILNNLLARTAVLKKTSTTLIYVGQSYSLIGHQFTWVGQTINLSFTLVGQNVRWFPLYVGQFDEWVGQCPWPTDILRPVGPLAGIEPVTGGQVIPVQRSNQLSYRVVKHLTWAAGSISTREPCTFCNCPWLHWWNCQFTVTCPHAWSLGTAWKFSFGYFSLFVLFFRITFFKNPAVFILSKRTAYNGL